MSDRSPGLRFGTSGLRGLVTEMTDLEVYLNTRGFLDYLQGVGDLEPGDALALGEDLRERDPQSGLSSSPRIAAAVIQAAQDAGFRVVHCGQVPTPALAYYARYPNAEAGNASMPAIMVTGSHIPADRNGIKFYRNSGEILKADEPGILACVAAARDGDPAARGERSLFDERGMLRAPPLLPPSDPVAGDAYVDRFVDLFPNAQPLAGQRVVSYEHSAVGRDLTRRILERLGAEVISVDRSDSFVSVDTENVTAPARARFRELVARHRPLAIVSTDGDGDRPMVVDETGRFHPGDVLGLIAADFLGARLAAVPVSSTDAIERWAVRGSSSGEPPMTVKRTRIGSPFVIEALNGAIAGGATAALGWEANGGVLTATDFHVNGRLLKALPTRDAILPILAALLLAVNRGLPVSGLFANLPRRASSAGLIDDFPTESSGTILRHFAPSDAKVSDVEFGNSTISVGRREIADNETLVDTDGGAAEYFELRRRLGHYYSEARHSAIVRINYLDGVRASFLNGDVVHLRPSGNAPQLRVYALSDEQKRADELVADAIAEPGGVLRRMAADLE